MASAHAQTDDTDGSDRRDIASQGEPRSPLHRSVVPPTLSRSVDGRGLPGAGSAAGWQRGVIDGRGLPGAGSAAGWQRGVIDPAARITHRAYEGLNASSVGLELGISVILGLVGGYYADRALGSTPWLMFLGLALGLVAGFRGVLRYVRTADRAAAREAAAAAKAKDASRG